MNLRRDMRSLCTCNTAALETFLASLVVMMMITTTAMMNKELKANNEKSKRLLKKFQLLSHISLSHAAVELRVVVAR